MASAIRVHIIDPDAARGQGLRNLLTTAGYDASSVGCAPDIHALERAPIEIVLLVDPAAADVSLALGTAGDVAVVVRLFSATVSAELATRAGAHEVVLPGAGIDAVFSAVERASRHIRMQRELSLLRARVSDHAVRTLVGKSSSMLQLRELVGRAAASHRTVLITGEAGSGKDVVARLIHDLSDRSSRPFVRVRCANVPADMLEVELFGTAAGTDQMGRQGLLETARGGTVVLDECVALPQSLRDRVARAIVQRAAARVGDDTSVSMDVRMILSVRDRDDARRGSAGEALLNGVSVLPIVVPPLRERRSDIPLLVRHFRERVAAERGLVTRELSADAMMSLLAQQWPGNVRELEHRVERDAYPTTSERPSITTPSFDTSALGIPADATWTIEQVERRYILHVLELEDGNQSRAADRLGIDRRTLYRKLKEYRRKGGVPLQRAV